MNKQRNAIYKKLAKRNNKNKNIIKCEENLYPVKKR